VLARFPSLAAKAPRVQSLVRRWDATAVIVLRFCYGLRIAGPLIIGSCGISPWRLALFNLIGVLIWAPIVAAVGYLAWYAIEQWIGHIHHAQIVLVMLLGAMCAYVLARFKFPGSRFIYYLMLAGLTFPIFLAIVPLFFILKNLGLINTLPGLIMVYVAFALPFTVFFLYAFFRTLPDDVYEAALIDGAGEWRTFFRIMLPMARPGMAAVAIFNFLGLWNQFLLPVALNTDQSRYVLTQGMASFASQAGYAVDFGALFAAVVITVVPVLIVYVIFQRRLEGSVSRGTFR